jgi:hypothetical protein
MPELKIRISFINKRGQYAPNNAREADALLAAWGKANKTIITRQLNGVEGFEYSVNFDGHGRDLALALRSHLLNQKMAADAEGVDITP